MPGSDKSLVLIGSPTSTSFILTYYPRDGRTRWGNKVNVKLEEGKVKNRRIKKEEKRKGTKEKGKKKKKRREGRDEETQKSRGLNLGYTLTCLKVNSRQSIEFAVIT